VTGKGRPQVVLSRRVSFEASHRYQNPVWSESENRRAFGPFTEPHRHRYQVEVSIGGQVDPGTGMSLDLGRLDQMLEEEVTLRFQGKSINEAEGFAGLIPTTENIAIHLWGRLEPRIRSEGWRLTRVRVYESPELFCDYRGEAGGA
jgi:6-pyruvoyltetrahydropterin/6-carboxytetrahydropterin synthase